MRHRLFARSLLAAVPLLIAVESAEAKCLTVDEAANACRYPQGDAWCREKFTDGRRYAYRDSCQAANQTASSQPVPPPPPSPTRVVAPAVPKTAEQLKQEEIARLRAKVKSEQQQAQAKEEQDAQQRNAYAAQQQAIAEQQARQQQMPQDRRGETMYYCSKQTKFLWVLGPDLWNACQGNRIKFC